MADTVEITPGTGAVIATDEVTIGGTPQQVQRVKLVDGTDGGTDLLPGDATKGLRVDPRASVTRVQATSAGLTTATTAYTNGDQLGTELTFSTVVRSSGGSGIIQSATLLDKAKIVAEVDLFLFDRSVTPAADNAAAAFSDADMVFCLGVVEFNPPRQNANNGLAQMRNGPIVIVPNASQNIYGHLVTRTGHTFFGATTDLVVSLGILQS